MLYKELKLIVELESYFKEEFKKLALPLKDFNINVYDRWDMAAKEIRCSWIERDLMSFTSLVSDELVARDPNWMITTKDRIYKTLHANSKAIQYRDDFEDLLK